MTRRLAAIIGAAVALLLVIGFVAWLWGSRDRAKDTAARDRTDAAVATGTAQAAKDASAAAEGSSAREAAINEQTEENADAILSQPDAGAPAGAAGDAGLRGLCLRHAYRDDPRCAELRRDHPGPAPQPR